MPTQTTQTFHGRLDEAERRHVETIQREVSYRFSAHTHPYVEQLVQRLIRRSVAGLQDADTEYAPEGAALPGSIVVALDGTTNAGLPNKALITLGADLQATLVNGAPLTLAAGLKIRMAAATAVVLASATQATLNDGMAGLPEAGGRFSLAQEMLVTVDQATDLTLSAAATFILSDGTRASVPAAAGLRLAAGAPLALPAGTQATLIKSLPLPALYAEIFSTQHYKPREIVQRPYPAKELDFSTGGAYAIYNWELFFHAPLTIAMHLSKNQRYAEAQRWFHYLFDPTDDSDGPTPQRFWKVRPFQTTDVRQIESLLVNLATGADPALREQTTQSIEAWKDAPFRPHVIARYRQQAYMIKTVMAYLDNLIAWGDSLFRQDTGEAIDEAMMVYVLAANILGPKPLPVPKKGSVRPQTYANLRADLDKFGNAMRDIEADAPFDLLPLPGESAADGGRLATLRSMGQALYFCVPRNDKLLGYWDTVADRLFKIRNSLNFQGVFRQLALFEPPIDPGMLVRATAAGLDVGAIVNGLNQPLPLVRFQLLVQKAAEICQEVKSLGASLLSAMEKEEGEALAILRAKHERAVMELVEQVRYAQVQESLKSREGLLVSLELAVQRYSYYERQLGKKVDEIENTIPELGELDRDSLTRMRLAAKEPEMVLREIEVDIAQNLNDAGGRIVSSYEAEELHKSNLARNIQDGVNTLQLYAQSFLMVPEDNIHAHYWGIGGSIELPGGEKLAAGARLAADMLLWFADRQNYEGTRAGRIGSYARREQEWAFQSNLAAGEITQIYKQIRAAELRQAIAELELKNHRQQMRHAEEIERFLNEEGSEKTGKKTNKALYTWMKREVKGLYAQCFQFAFDIARKAERALQHELGSPDLRYLTYGYLAGNEGLLAGEKLYFDIKRMELAYHELNQREYELTKHISLLQVDPLALLQLRSTGTCTLRLPETLFDMDGPGQYFRRIKTVALSIPCVIGPYASVNCKLTLLKSSIRTSPAIDGEYGREGAEDGRFQDYFGSMQSIVTSSSQNDSGLFEANLRDERYLPFENSGVVSEWRLELPANPSKHEPCQFDYDTISDAILHVRYTAREGGDILRQAAIKQLSVAIEQAQAAGSTRLFSIRYEFPTEWAKFQTRPANAGQRFELAISLRPEHFPFWSQGRLKSVKGIQLLARSAQNPGPATIDVADAIDKSSATAKKDTLARSSDQTLGNLLVGKLSNIGLPAKPDSVIQLFFDDNALDDLWFAVEWGMA